ncbi:PREDICTED: serine hydrolase-like protein isoform X1 [Vollenhovia emeryi]|uniref:serine hydrolase-like protein isoform X1 n=1 Tax=Vollenhovia emeryi TaxID=411798 RepID=UPI0005F51C75|nr:PREDICTED: serine hydrolase-like protein isoform X1 [Vollenhovia emeryi]XP_011858123.1 PREDICTED: serine hydrolase-like protein isoform X1 [Vollenhovia emeryi]XP_011858124.1 PREDICTED: serine hydrolase-like protein isoform X1 [Vollenhovia emeryi]XP_011858125.1 PREDICTED: serine hydrolase-like protein isoform X1 [Vollenhovia emeryi]XP_011858126.1 PREDICTED: serine hydrolase-like protein isoform X1 [Vollenhovia emeryi]XP_011858127.1 PREDICTED: serine hydrolase-like protein isoform X1 [Vollenh
MTEVGQQCTEIKLSVPWGHVAAKTYGSSAGKPVLVVHGRLDNAGSFSRLMKYLPNELFYYVCIDLPGHGWSSHFPSWMMLDITDFVHALYFILEALQWETCIYIGHSFGAQIGLMFSVIHPNRIRKLIALDGILMNFYEVDQVKYFNKSSTFSIKAGRDEKPLSFNKEEVLHALKFMRIATLNSEAAEAMFEHAVTKVNGRYIYNRDIRLKNHTLSYMDLKIFQKFNNNLSIPIYLFLSSNGIVLQYKEHESVLEIMKSKTMLEITYVDGDHDAHNNNPEKVAPFICKILNSNNSSKL